MSILTDALIDAKAELCWNHQQQQLKKELEIDCICGQLADMIYLTRQEISKEIKAQIKDNEWAGAYLVAAAIARGTPNDGRDKEDCND